MTKSSSISVLITYFNEQELLVRCLQSINKQLLSPFEVIIYDDASEFAAEQYVDHSLYHYPIKIVKSEINKGPGYGRNLLMSLVKSDYFRFQDADDELFNNTLLEIESAINKSKADIILNEVTSYNEKGELISEKVIGLSKNIDDIFDFSLTHALLTPSITYKRKTAILTDRFKERNVLPQSEDTDFNRRIFSKTNSFYFIDKSLAKQNIRLLSHSSQGQLDIWTSNLKSLLDLREEINVNHLPAFAEALLKTGLQLYNLKDFQLTKIAFDTYKATGFADYKQYNSIKRVMAKLIGPMATEDISMLYRKLMPQKIRKKIR